MYIAGRAIIGGGGGIIKAVAVALLQEIAHPRLRPVVAAIYYSLYYSGSTLAAWLSFASLHIEGDWSWRFPSLFQIVGPIIVLLLTMTIPESPRWLVAKDRSEDALKTLAKYHALVPNFDDASELTSNDLSLVMATPMIHWFNTSIKKSFPLLNLKKKITESLIWISSDPLPTVIDLPSLFSSLWVRTGLAMALSVTI
jgi:MFS family permease